MQKHCGKYILPSNNIEGMQLEISHVHMQESLCIMQKYNGPNLSALDRVDCKWSICSLFVDIVEDSYAPTIPIIYIYYLINSVFVYEASCRTMETQEKKCPLSKCKVLCDEIRVYRSKTVKRKHVQQLEHMPFFVCVSPEMCVVRGGSSNGLQPKYIACSSFFSFHVVFAFK